MIQTKYGKIIVSVLLILVVVIVLGFRGTLLSNRNQDVDSGIVSATEVESDIDSESGRIHMHYQTADKMPQGVEALLMDFMLEYSEALAELQETDLLLYFHMDQDEVRENAYINQLALSYLIKVREMQANDLGMTDYDFQIDILKAEEAEPGIWQIGLAENSRVNYVFTEDVDTYAVGVAHEFTLAQTDGQWKIVYHSKEEDVFYLAEYSLAKDEEEVEGPDEENLSVERELSWDMRYAETREILLSYAEESITRNAEEHQSYLEGGVEQQGTDLVWEYDYDRQAAVSYSYKWIGQEQKLRNPDWHVYDGLGGNCNNFISQCLHAGGIPMDIEGHVTLQWKWYEEYLSSREAATGRAASWTGVDEFYEYARDNQGYGLVALVGRNIYSGRIGDIIQYGTRGDWNHSVIIVDVVRDEHGRIVDYLINSNTTDRIACPMSAYAYTDIRLIRIMGYNGAEEKIEDVTPDISAQ